MKFWLAWLFMMQMTGIMLVGIIIISPLLIIHMIFTGKMNLLNYLNDTLQDFYYVARHSIYKKFNLERK